jgi:hypothetical protein
MKTLLTSKTIVALAVAIAAFAANVTNAYEQPIPPPPSASDLPPSIPPGGDLAQVHKLVQANVDLSIIKNFITNSPRRFELDASKIIALNDAGVPSTLLDAMLEHDRQIIPNATIASATPTPPPATAPTVVTAPPPVTVSYFYDTLSPYGNWVEIDGYGRCWRPTTVVYDSNWRPYCDRGRWVYTDCGWYWDSDYAWGATFHYGRWFRDSRFGWCWWPETTWAPSWVVWRSGADVCGWAPLPPRYYYRQNHGFFYNGSSVTVGFDFGLNESCFSFVSYNHFFDRRLRDHCEAPRRVTQIYNNTTIVNNYNYNGSRNTVVNNGIPVDRFASATRRPVHAVAVNELPNATRQGWRGETRHDRAPGSVNPVATHASYNPNGQSTPNANGGTRATGNVGSPQAGENNGPRGHGNAPGNTGAQTGNQIVNPASPNVYPQANGRDTTRQAAGSPRPQSENNQPNSDGQRAPQSSRMDRLIHGPNTVTTPQLTTTAPPRTTLPVEQPQIIRPQTPAQSGQVFDRNSHSSRPEPQRNQSAAVINTTPPQRSELQVQQPQIVRPTTPNAVLQPSPSYPQRATQPAETRVNPFQRLTERSSPETYAERTPNRAQPSAQIQPQSQPQRVERPAPPSRSNGDNPRSDRDKR